MAVSRNVCVLPRSNKQKYRWTSERTRNGRTHVKTSSFPYRSLSLFLLFIESSFRRNNTHSLRLNFIRIDCTLEFIRSGRIYQIGVQCTHRTHLKREHAIFDSLMALLSKYHAKQTDYVITWPSKRECLSISIVSPIDRVFFLNTRYITSKWLGQRFFNLLWIVECNLCDKYFEGCIFVFLGCHNALPRPLGRRKKF